MPKKKREDFVQKISTQRRGCLHLFLCQSIQPIWEERFGHPKFQRRHFFHGDITETKSCLLRIFSQKIDFFTHQNMNKAIAKNFAETKGPTIQMNKTIFKLPRLRTNSTPNSSKIAFLGIQEIWNMAYSKAKNLCD